jgi:hypothetical protein
VSLLRLWVEEVDSGPHAVELLPVPYFHVVFTLPPAIGVVAYQNKAKVYGLLFTTAAEALTTIAADPKHLGAEIGVTAALHTWGQNLDHHPHVHCNVSGGGIALNRTRWIHGRPSFFLSVRVLSRLFRLLFLQGLAALHNAGKLQFFADLAGLEAAGAFRAYLAPLRKTEWVVYAKRPFAGPAQMLAYLTRCTHRVAIGNGRLMSASADAVRFHWKDYRGQQGEGDEPCHRRVHPALPDAHPVRPVPPHSLLRLRRQRTPLR